MLELDNRSNWSAGLYPGWSRAGERQQTVVLKAAFGFDEKGQLTPIEAAPAIEEADRYVGEPGKSSLAAACETVPFKQGGEVLLTGTACPPKPGAGVMEVSVGLRRADDSFWEKTLRLFGPRRWEKGLLGVGISKPAPLNPLALRYEHAYGGCDPNHEDQLYGANPVGQGFSQKGWRVNEMELPQIEIGPKFISSPTSRPQPAGYGPLAPFWEPRLEGFKCLDEEAAAWGGCPFGDQAPPDLYNAAPLDQRFAEPFVGGETLRLKGLIEGANHREGVLIDIPRPRADLKLIIDGKTQSLHPVCDTLQIDADAGQIFLLYRAAIPWDIKDRCSGWVILRDLDQEERQQSETILEEGA